MRENLNNINRRSFIGTTGAVASGIILIPGSFINASEKIASCDEFSIASAGIGSEGNPNRVFAEGGNKLSEEKWWEKAPLRIVELEEGYEFGEKFELLKDLGANMEHLTRFTETSPGTSFLDAHNLFGGKKVNFSSFII